jgi:hypothetical protein
VSWVKHPNGVSVDNYGLTLVDPETGKHVVVYANKKIIRVENVEDNDEDINQFEEMPLFTNPMNIKHIKKDFDKKLMSYI